MPVESSPVEIRITVVDQNSGEVIANIERNLTQVGAAGASSGQKVAQGMDRITGHTLTALDNVRLLRDDIGIRIPRSMEKAIASSQAMMGAINAVGAGLLAIGAIDIGIRIAQGLKHVWDEYLSLTSAAEKYNEEVKKSKEEDFTNTRSIEDTRLRIDEATRSMNALNAAAKEFASGDTFWGRMSAFMFNPQGAIVSQLAAHQMAGQAVAAQGQKDKLGPREIEQQHQQNLLQIERNHALDAELRGHAKITAELEKQRAINAENRSYGTQMDAALHNSTTKDSGVATEHLNDEIALRKAQAETYNLNREQAHELMRMRQEAVQAGLHGEALYQAQESAAIEELKFKDMDSVAARNWVHQKFHEEEMKRLEDERAEVARRAREADASGLAGIAKIEYEGKSRDQQILSDAGRGKYMPLSDAQQDRISNQKQTNNEVMQAQEEFHRKIDQFADESAQHQISGFARIHAEEKRQLDQLAEEFKRTYGQLDPNSSEYKQGQMQLYRGQQAIHGNAYQQEAELARKNEEETEQIEAQARIKSLSAEKQQTAAIEAEYEERLRKYQEQLNQKEIDEQDFNRRVVAAAQERDAEMAENARREREKLTGELSGFFRNPTEALKSFGDKMAGEAAAAMVQRIQGHVPGRSTQSAGLGGIFDRIAGGAHLPGMPEWPQHGTGVGNATARSAMTVAQAQIYITGSASIIGVGSAGAISAGGSTLDVGAGSASSSSSSIPGGLTLGPGGSIVPQGAGLGPGGTSSPCVLCYLQQVFHLAKSSHDLLGSLKNAVASFHHSMLGGGGIRANAAGALGGAMGLFSAFEGNGGFGGAAGGALSGMKFGSAIAGPVGAAVGAVGGAILGAFGFGGRERARVYWLKQGRPRMNGDIDSFQQGGMDYLTAYMDIEQLETEAKHTTNKMGAAAESYYQDTIKKEIADAEQKLTREQKAGRSQFGFSTAMFDIGTDYVPRTGLAVIHEGERIVPSDQNERITRAIESGSGVMPADMGDGSEMHLHVHAIDAKSAVQFLMSNKQAVRAALNASFAEYGGMANV